MFCRDENCPDRKNCLRFLITSFANFFSSTPRTEENCPQFLPKAENKKPLIKEIKAMR